MVKHCEESEQDIKLLVVEWLCGTLDGLTREYARAFECAGFCITVQKRDYLNRRIEITVEEAGHDMPVEHDVETVVKGLYAHLGERFGIGPQTLETVFWRKNSFSEVSVMFSLVKSPYRIQIPAELEGETLRTHPTPVRRAPPPQISRTPEPTEPDPGEPLPVISTVVWKIRN
jgi:hypothetical protein